MLQLVLLLAFTGLPSLISAHTPIRRTPQDIDGTPTRPEQTTVEPYQPCGLLTKGSPPAFTLTQCHFGAECTPKDSSCNNSDCPHHCVPKLPCGSSNSCPLGFSCSSESEQDGVCERIPQAPGPNSTAGARCGMILANCPEGQICATINPACYSLDVCYGVCKNEPVYKPSKYPSCGGFTATPSTCSEPNICIDDPRRGQSCGMACDMPGICVK